MASSGRTAHGPTLDAEASLRPELKRFIVQHLKLAGADPDSIDDDAPLAGGSLDLDSIDVLELVTGVERRYGLRFEDPELVQKVFRSVATLAAHVASHRGPR
jgi:acyl carrier protein